MPHFGYRSGPPGTAARVVIGASRMAPRRTECRALAKRQAAGQLIAAAGIDIVAA